MIEQKQLKFGAWYQYQDDWLDKDEVSDLMSWLVENMAWEERKIYALGKEVIQPRLMSWCGELPYQYSGQILPPVSIPPPLQTLQEKLSDLCDVPFNHIVLNRYRNQRDHMALHADNEPELGRNPVIAALSLGSERYFQLVPKPKKGRYKHTTKILLRSGSLLVMGGRCQHTWRHSVPKSKELVTERINITFRYLRGAPGWREPKYWLEGTSDKKQT